MNSYNKKEIKIGDKVKVNPDKFNVIFQIPFRLEINKTYVIKSIFQQNGYLFCYLENIDPNFFLDYFLLVE